MSILDTAPKVNEEMSAASMPLSLLCRLAFHDIWGVASLLLRWRCNGFRQSVLQHNCLAPIAVFAHGVQDIWSLRRRGDHKQGFAGQRGHPRGVANDHPGDAPTLFGQRDVKEPTGPQSRIAANEQHGVLGNAPHGHGAIRRESRPRDRWQRGQFRAGRAHR